ncbi:Pyrophosphate-energized vacuolar membrane proton pump 1 [Datura stramonium]|uniref:Pyrophosphate-energized vacuolar membrane proton pump 1 n=1 Tax=Datura stramonium TaxID=4076 RepID=A0ABS8SPK1_DATST|nr:Pyrophosphate-energized vacuolar membrane proton pump 1 [Datura stramonium]
MESALLPDLGTNIVIPVCAVVGIVFSLFQWYLVSRVKVSSERGATSPSNNNKSGYNNYLIEEEEGINNQNNFVCFLPYFIGLLILGSAKGEELEDFHHNLDYSLLELGNRFVFPKTFELPLPIAFHLQEQIAKCLAPSNEMR